MLNSGNERLSMKVYSSIQKFMEDYHQNSALPRSHLSRLAVLRELVVQAARGFGYEVVNADSLQEVYHDGRIKDQVVYFSVNADNPVVRRHLGAGGMAVFISGGKVLVASGSRSRTITKTKTTPRSLPGSHLLEDALAAAAGLMVLGVRPEEVWRDSSHRSTGMAFAEKPMKL